MTPWQRLERDAPNLTQRELVRDVHRLKLKRDEMLLAGRMVAVLRKAEGLLSRWERVLDPKSEVAELLAELRAALPSREPDEPEHARGDLADYLALASVFCLDCGVEFSEAIGRLHRDRTGHAVMKPKRTVAA